MGRKKVRLDSSETPPGTPPEGGTENPSESIFDRMAEDSYVRLRRRHDTTKMYEYFTRLTPQEATEEYVAERFGGGEWQFTEMRRNEEGKFVWGRMRTIKIAGPLKPMTPQGPTPTKPVIGTVTDADIPPGTSAADMMNNLMVTGIMDLMKVQRESSMVMIENQRNQKSVDWGAILTAIIPLLTALLTREQRDPIEAARQIAELANAGKGPVGPVSPLKERLEELSILRDLTGEGANPDSMTGLLARVAPDIIQALSTAKAQDAASGPRPPHRLTPGAPVAISFETLLRQYGPLLNQQAAHGTGADRYAAITWDQVKAPYRPAFAQWLARPDVLGLVYQAVPGAPQYGAWWEEWLAHLRQFAGVTGATPELPLPEAPGTGDLEPPL